MREQNIYTKDDSRERCGQGRRLRKNKARESKSATLPITSTKTSGYTQTSKKEIPKSPLSGPPTCQIGGIGHGRKKASAFS